MDSASSLAYPGGRNLAGWWRQLQPHRPTALWVGYLFVHRVEAMVEYLEPRPLDALTVHVLQALAIDQPEPGPHVHAGNPLLLRLHVPAAAVHQLLIGLEREALVRRCEPGCWCLSERGREVLQARADRTPRCERRTFPFIERLGPAGRRVAPPHFAPVAECPAVAWDVNDAHRFDPEQLRECIVQPASWHQHYGFPRGVQRLFSPAEPGTDHAWEQVIIDRSERSCVALAAIADDALLGFAVEADGWKLHDETPVIRLGASARDALGDLAVGSAAWEEAWRMWCRQRHLPLAEADACRLQLQGPHLNVAAPASFLQRLRAVKSDIFREESAVLAGDGYLRAAAVLRLQADPLP